MTHMDTSELQNIALRSRFMRETGVALIITSALLLIFLFIPFRREEPVPTAPAASVASAFAHIPIEAKAAIVYDLATGKTLYEKNADAQLPLASLTKLLTIYAALAKLPPETQVVIPASAARAEPPRAFKAGQTFSLADLARLTLTASLNDGAAAIASSAAERENISEAAMLAGAAGALGLPQTYAVNGNGLDMSSAVSGGYGSARDMARLAGALAELAPSVAEATTHDSAHAVSREGVQFTAKNTDPIVGSLPRLLLSKTGYTDLAGGNLAIVFDAGILHPIAVVVLGSSLSARFTDSSALVAATLAHFAGVESL